ncbi:MAG: hypothetical protein A2Z20_08590 [Bdellovibrionales bacterium RBG_16_40_8]|nr:MAG: hypothetical protein A2Z20_08590 [Bdellovibrionales bacterium RBG_16_40_8]
MKKYLVRKKQLTRIIAVFSILWGIVHCASRDVSKDAVSIKESGESWPSRMRGMAKNLEALMPYAFSHQEFTSLDNKKKVKELIADFEKSVEVVPQHTGELLLGKDPIVKYAINRLRSNTRHAQKAFDEGYSEFSRNVLRENLSLCFSCHTTMQFGPVNNFSTKALPSDFRIQPTERAEYYVATRQFDRAVDVLEGVLRSPANTLEDPREQVTALKKYLSLQVRVKKNPAAAASLIENFLNNQKLPYFISTDAESWLKSLRDWQKEKVNGRSTFNRAQSLLSKAKFKQASHGFQSSYVEYLRASALLHESLRDNHDSAIKGKIYELLGESYETLAETGTWDLPEVYYEACIRTAPKTPVAKGCYIDFERSIILGFSGSAGIFIPKEEKERLAELKLLSGINK